MKKIMPFLLALILMCQPSGINAEAAGSASDLCGTWEGTYEGGTDDRLIIRPLTLNIYYCDSETGDFEGIAEIDNGENGRYFFTGSINFGTGAVSFSGKKWIENPSSFAFASFSGTVSGDYDSMEGQVDSLTSDRSFSLEKTSDEYTSASLNLEEIPLDWTGEYDGKDGITVVRRNYEFHIQSISENGDITGTAIISPSDKAASSLGANGSYLFSGTIDFRYGGIQMQGYEWTDYPDNGDNWEFVELSGIIDADAGTIEGISEKGIWSMSSMDYISYDTDSGFAVEEDNNRFANSGDESVENAGFMGITDYHLDSDYFDSLTKSLSAGEKNRIKKKMNDEWNGSGYGIAATMALLYEDYLSMDELSSEPVASYYDMDYPYLNEKLLNYITYYQLSQSLIGGGKESASVSRAYNYNFLSGLSDRDSNYDSLSVFLQQLVNYASDGHLELLGLSTKEQSDTLLVTGCRYEADSEIYRLEIYDVNCSSLDTDALIMEIEKDFSSFNFTDAKGELITDDNYVSAYFLDYENMASLIPGGSGTDNFSYTYIEFSLESSFTLTTAEGDELSYDGNEISGDIYVYDIATEGTDDSTRMILATDGSDSYELSDMEENADIEIYNENDYLALKGSHLTSAYLSFEEGIQIQGTDFDFEAYITTDEEADENEKGLISVFGSAADTVEISQSDGEVSVISREWLQGVTISSYTGVTVSAETIDETVNRIEMIGTKINYTAADSAESDENEGLSGEESILRQLEELQSEVNELKEENDRIWDILEEKETESN